MTSSEKSGIVKFLDKEFTLLGLKQAIDKSSESYIEAGKEISELRLDRESLPAEWDQQFKKPVLTLHEGKYVIIHMDGNMLIENTKAIVEKGVSKRIVTKGFKAKFVTKYNFNQAKVVPPAPPVVHETLAPSVYDLAKRYNNNRNGDNKPRSYGEQNQNGGWKNNNHRGGNRG